MNEIRPFGKWAPFRFGLNGPSFPETDDRVPPRTFAIRSRRLADNGLPGMSTPLTSASKNSLRMTISLIFNWRMLMIAEPVMCPEAGVRPNCPANRWVVRKLFRVTSYVASHGLRGRAFTVIFPSILPETRTSPGTAFLESVSMFIRVNCDVTVISRFPRSPMTDNVPFSQSSMPNVKTFFFATSTRCSAGCASAWRS